MTKFFEKIVACGLRAKGQMKEFETSSEKENISSTMNYADDPSSTAPYKLHVFLLSDFISPPFSQRD